jgi:hypothetical protein
MERVIVPFLLFSQPIDIDFMMSLILSLTGTRELTLTVIIVIACLLGCLFEI